MVDRQSESDLDSIRNSCDVYYSGYDVGGYIVGDVMLDDIGEVVSPIAGLSIISVS